MMLSAEDLLQLSGDGPAAAMAVQHEIERFVLREARLLDSERYRDWYELLADDLIYWAPLRENRFRRDRTPELSPDRVALFDETKASIDLRLKRLESGMAWAEDPATRHVYAVSNIEAFEYEADDHYEVHSVFSLYRNRAERDASLLMGRRRDILRQTEGRYQVRARLILLQQATLLTKNLSVFF
ncbi:MAG: 3-phenylpropionate/cinnamic acid dioxygenase subunit beta [Pseudomonadota bacterium]